MLKQADLQVAAAQSELNKNNTIEAQVALIDALANKEGVLAQVEGLRSEQKANDLALDREQIELTNSKGESESRLSIERKRFNAEQIEDELLRLEALKEIDLLEAEQETIRLEAIVENANAETQAKIDAQIALDEFLEQSRQTGITRDTEIKDAKGKIAAENSKNEIKWSELTQEEKLKIISKGFSDLSSILGEESAAGKAAAIAGATIDTFQSATSSYNSLSVIPIIGPALGAAAAGAAIASGLATVKKIASTKVPGGGGGGGGSVSAPSVPSAPSLPPSFNIVGASDTNQLADAVAGQSQAPIQTYVVANDVTTAQSLQNNIVEGATIG